MSRCENTHHLDLCPDISREALVNANVPEGPFQNLATSTVGVISLGTPHRGTKAAKLGELIAKTGSTFGFNTDSRILQDLNRDSEALADLLYIFSSWLFRSSVPVVCFFEQHRTNYGGKLKGFVSWEEMVRAVAKRHFPSTHPDEYVVNEWSACMDGHRKIALPTDHFKINKFRGPDDPSFRYVARIIVEMAGGAEQRFTPDYTVCHYCTMKCSRLTFIAREIVQDNSSKTVSLVQIECVSKSVISCPKGTHSLFALSNAHQPGRRPCKYTSSQRAKSTRYL